MASAVGLPDHEGEPDLGTKAGTGRRAVCFPAQGHLRWPRRAADGEDPLAPKYRGQTSLPPSDQLKGWSWSKIPFFWLIFMEQGAGGRIYSASALTQAVAVLRAALCFASAKFSCVRAALVLIC